MVVLPACLAMHHMHAVPSVARRGCQMHWDWGTENCELPHGITPGSSIRAASALNPEPLFQSLY